jgi:hypothetical protein
MFDPGRSEGAMPKADGMRALVMLLSLTFAAAPSAAWGQVPPLMTPILAAGGAVRGEARVFPNYIEVVDSIGAPRGAVGVVQAQGRLRLFLIRSDQQRTLIGWAEEHRLFNPRNELVGYFYWTPTFSYVYDSKMKKVGEARCLAYQGVCAAAVAGFLLGLL